MQVRRPKGVLGKHEAFVTRAAQASAAPCMYNGLSSLVNPLSNSCRSEGLNLSQVQLTVSPSKCSQVRLRFVFYDV